MRITTWNVNGLRAALRKRFVHHLNTLGPDVLLLQEVRARPNQLGDWHQPEGYTALWHPAEKNGYSGVAIWSRKPVEILDTGMTGPDPEGRLIRVRVDGIQFISCYLPSGSSGDVRQSFKDDWMNQLQAWITPLLELDEPVILGGDLNIAPTEDDIHNPKSNKDNSGFKPHERAWFQSLLDQGWSDLVRQHMGPGKGPYSWWSNRGRARELDRGWRIDHLLGNPAAALRLKSASILREAGMDTSDHAPVTIELGRKPRKAR